MFKLDLKTYVTAKKLFQCVLQVLPSSQTFSLQKQSRRKDGSLYKKISYSMYIKSTVIALCWSDG